METIGFGTHTLITDLLAILGLFLLTVGPIFFSGIQKSVIRQRLFTKIDGEKLFEKLKFDLKIDGDLTGIDRVRLYRSSSYALTIFNKAMEYNKRDLVWYYNELYSRTIILKSIAQKAWLNFFSWMIFISVALIASAPDFFRLYLHGKPPVDNGLGANILLFITGLIFTSVIKYFQWTKVKETISDKVRQINLVKKEKVWSDFKMLFWIEVGALGLGFLLIIINQFF